MTNIRISDQEKNAVLISNMATRPNGNSQYGHSGMSAADVKEKFDAPFKLLVERHNALCNFVAAMEDVAKQSALAANAAAAAANMATERADAATSAANKAEAEANAAAEKANNTELGNIDEALDAILEIQNTLLNGGKISFSIEYQAADINDTFYVEPGTTWGEWAETPENKEKEIVYNDGGILHGAWADEDVYNSAGEIQTLSTVILHDEYRIY